MLRYAALARSICPLLRLAEKSDAIEEIYEPFLIQIGFLNRTPRGRVATQLAYDHFGITPNRRQQSSLF
jgi:holliday junction DNA helicase RuvB